jgi:hypothetical protein
MKTEFKRFGLEKFGLNCRFRTSRALGLFIGLQNNTILVLSSGLNLTDASWHRGKNKDERLFIRFYLPFLFYIKCLFYTKAFAVD